jgi:hypothetical protein
MAANFGTASRIAFGCRLSVSAAGRKNANCWMDGAEYISQPVYGRQVGGEFIQCCNSFIVAIGLMWILLERVLIKSRMVTDRSLIAPRS